MISAFSKGSNFNLFHSQINISNSFTGIILAEKEAVFGFLQKAC